MTRNKLMKTTAISLVLAAALATSGCQMVLVENPTARSVQDAKNITTTGGDMAVAEQLLRDAIPQARSESLQMRAQYELARLLLESPTNKARQAEALTLLQGIPTYPSAQRTLGNLYAEGVVVRKDVRSAVGLLRSAAAAGSNTAAMDLAVLLRANPSLATSSRELPTLVSRGIAALDAESDAGNASSSRQLGEIYRDGVLVAKDLKKAEGYFYSAVEQGSTTAVNDLADLWIKGDASDKQRALRLLEMGASRDVSRSITLLGDLYRDGVITTRDRDRAIAYYLQGAQGYDDSTVNRIANTLKSGGVSAVRRREAMDYLSRAAAAGSANAALKLGEISEAGGNNALAAKYYLRAANAGFGSAKLAIGKMYFEGRGVRQDYNLAVKYLKGAAAAGYGGAAAYLGEAYAEGKGVAQDWTQARKYLAQAAKANKSVSAATLLAESYMKGLGGPVDIGEAMRWYEFAAKNGSVAAMRELAAAYRSGAGVTQNDRLAFDWTAKAAKGGSRSAWSDGGWAYATGTGAPRNPAQARRYFEQAVIQDPSLAGRIARSYAAGDRGIKDLEEAAYWTEKAVAAGDPQSLRNQAAAIASTDAEQALALYRKAAAAGDPGALAWMAEREFGLKNYTGAIDLLNKAVDAGSGAAALRLGKIYAFGDGVPTDLKQGFRYYMTGAKLGNGEAMFWVGMSYREGLGVDKNEEQAQIWLAKAAEAGFSAPN